MGCTSQIQAIVIGQTPGFLHGIKSSVTCKPRQILSFILGSGKCHYKLFKYSVIQALLVITSSQHRKVSWSLKHFTKECKPTPVVIVRCCCKSSYKQKKVTRCTETYLKNMMAFLGHSWDLKLSSKLLRAQIKGIILIYKMLWPKNRQVMFLFSKYMFCWLE